MASPDNPFRSERLLYRAVESPDDDTLFQRIQSEPAELQNSNAFLMRPQSRKDAANYQKYVAEEALIGVVICLLPSGPDKAAVPIGTVHLAPFKPTMSHHRFTELGINILNAYHGKGYGSEAILWALQWAFQVAGVHRVSLRVFEWNYGARKLYEKLGFKQEGVTREEIYHQGRFWDGYQFGMLDREWREMYGTK